MTREDVKLTFHAKHHLPLLFLDVLAQLKGDFLTRAPYLRGHGANAHHDHHHYLGCSGAGVCALNADHAARFGAARCLPQIG